MRIPSYYHVLYTKKNIFFCDFLFASLHDEALPKIKSTLEGKNLLPQEKSLFLSFFFFVEFIQVEKGGKK